MQAHQQSRNAKLYHRRLKKFVSLPMPLSEANILKMSFRECEVILGEKQPCGKYEFKPPTESDKK